jgi:hypothetical protein
MAPPQTTGAVARSLSDQSLVGTAKMICQHIGNRSRSTATYHRFCLALRHEWVHLPRALNRVVTVTSEGLPVGPESQISEDLRQRGIAVVQGLFADGRIDENAFHQALDQLFAVHSETEFCSLMRSLPPPVAVTPPARRRQEPLEIETSMGEVRLDGRWQVGRMTKIDTGMGAVIVDLTQAEFDDWDVEIVVHTHMGDITVIAPFGLDIRLVGRNSPVTTCLDPPIPSFPVVRLSATSDMGAVRLVNPTEPGTRRKRWRRRGDPTRGT